MKKLKNISTALIAAVTIIVLIWIIFMGTAKAAYPPDGNTHITEGNAVLDFQVKQENMFDGKYMECTFQCLNSNTRDPSDDAEISVIADHFSPKGRWPFPFKVGANVTVLQYAVEIEDLQDAQFHFIITGSNYNQEPEIATNCSIKES